jgi:homoserine kinase
MAESLPRPFTIRVPSTSANIGPGFDVVGLSLSLYLTLTVTFESSISSAGPPILTHTGEGAGEVPLDPYKNLTTRVALYVLRCHGIQRFFQCFTLDSDSTRDTDVVPSSSNITIKIHVHNEIPFGRGLGSSGAAIIAGILLANELGRLNLSHARMLDFALMVERHPDNVTAALVGGFVGSYLRELDKTSSEAASVPLSEVLPEYPPDAGEDWGLNPPIPPFGIGHFVRFGWSENIKAVAIIPRFELSTAKARQVLPEQYSRKDLVRSSCFYMIIIVLFSTSMLDFSSGTRQVFNLQRLAVLTTALAATPPDPELIYEAMEDRVHQPYRRELVSGLNCLLFSVHILTITVKIPGLPEVTSSITPRTHMGLLGICLSGAGPTILALATHGFEGIAESARDIFKTKGIEVDWKVLHVVGGSEVIL